MRTSDGFLSPHCQLARGQMRETLRIFVSGFVENRNVNHARSVTSSSYTAGSIVDASCSILPPISLLRWSIHCCVKSAMRGPGWSVMTGITSRPAGKFVCGNYACSPPPAHQH